VEEDLRNADVIHSVVLNVVEEIGPDISYVRLSHQSGSLYLTGVEVGLLLGAGVVSAFLVGVAKGVAETAGKEAGKATARVVIRRLEQLRAAILELLRKDSTDFRQEYRAIEESLAEVRSQLERQDESIVELVERTTEQQTIEVATELSRYGFIERAVSKHSINTVRTIRRTWTQKG
jgi:hypothetical protein